MNMFKVEMSFGDGSHDKRMVSAEDEHEALNRCLYIDATRVVITRLLKPTDWEEFGGARVGDIWETGDQEFVALDGSDGLSLVPVSQFEPFVVYGKYGDNPVSAFPALNPKLVRRRGVTIEG